MLLLYLHKLNNCCFLLSLITVDHNRITVLFLWLLCMGVKGETEVAVTFTLFPSALYLSTSKTQILREELR